MPITPEHASSMAWIIQLLFLAGVLRMTWLLLFGKERKRTSEKGSNPHKLKRIRLVSWVITLGFLGILAYQATWQLGGFLRPQFVSFMQKHDRRVFNPALHIQRGNILDRRGRLLAENHQDGAHIGRRYSLGAAAAHLVGYFHPSYGIHALESAANPMLSGLEDFSVEGWQSVHRQLITREKLPQGKDLRMTLDGSLQQAIYQQMAGQRYDSEAGALAGKPLRGAAVVLDIRDGSILSACSTPSFDPNHLKETLGNKAAPGSPLVNRALHGLYPPGSIFKVAIGSYYLDKHLLGANFPLTMDCGPEYRTPDGKGIIRDYVYYAYQSRGAKWPGFGRIDLAKAIEQSCNVYFATVGATIGKEGYDWLRRLMRLDQPLTLYSGPSDQIQSARSRLPQVKQGDVFEMAMMGIGQGKLMVTPLHMAMITASIANDGILMSPRLTFAEPASQLGRVMGESTALQMQGMMERVTQAGTARKAFDGCLIRSGGKTGSAENPNGAAHAWFVGFAPVQRPQLAVAILVENGGSGGAVAAPLARYALEQAMRLGLMSP
ncbi:MAG: penicillin-binding protein 2 [Verrucomicrobia bacterium]|nr:penicillin-binding protein 2 [Verrucomicrobiota bacterium]